MGAARGYYSLIQYCPDPSRAEGANVGVLLFCPELKFIEARTAAGNDRVRRFFGRTSFDPDRLRAAKRAMEYRLRKEQENFQTLDDLNHFIETRANDLTLTPPRPMKVSDPKAELQGLFKELVGGRARKEPPPPELRELDQLLRQPKLENRIQFDKRVRVPLIGRELRVPYAYQNGALNLIKPHRFPESEDTATSAAMRLAVQGDLLYRHKEDEIERRLIVVSTFGQSQVDQSLRDRISKILEEYHTRLVPQAKIPEFVREIDREAHESLSL
jgi:hypothetical protein